MSEYNRIIPQTDHAQITFRAVHNKETYKSIADSYGASVQRVRRIESKICREILRRLGNGLELDCPKFKRGFDNPELIAFAHRAYERRGERHISRHTYHGK
jgi:hypothetical protein